MAYPEIIFTMEGEENSLAHYGVLGMKWGVRRYQNKDGSLTAAGKKRQESRDRMVKSTEESIARSETEKRNAKKVIADIDKNGIKSRYLKDMYDNDPNFNEDLVDIWDQGRDLWDEGKGARPLESLTKKTQKEIVKRAKERYSYEAEYDSKRDRKIIENIKSTPLHKKSYAEAFRTEQRVRNGAAIAGAILPVAGSVVLSRAIGRSAGETAVAALKTTVLVSPMTALTGYLVAPDISDNYLKKHIDGK